MLHRHTAPDEASVAQTSTVADQGCAIVLEPVSHPELDEIRIDESLFAVGRTELPFASYPGNVIADLSRRHARIFSEYGFAYIADLDSKNGTTVNGVNIRQKTSRLQEADEICFGRLCYRVHLRTQVEKPRPATTLRSLTLTPERDDLGLQPIVIAQFPFLISKTDATFSRYKADYPHQVNYISRRHAHIFLKGGLPFIEDLGSTNGTFVSGKRLDEHATGLKDGDTLGFGGHHFVYKVSLQMDETELDPTVTKVSMMLQGAAKGSATPPPASTDKTTFVAAADSFLDIFCVDHNPQQDDEVNNEDLKQPEEAGKESDKRRQRGKVAVFVSELAGAFAGGERKKASRVLGWTAAFMAVLGIGAGVLYLQGAPEREVNELLARGEHAQAADAAGRHLARAPDNAELRSLGAEALFKAHLPRWMAQQKDGDFDGAADVLSRMKQQGGDNAEVQPLLRELAWVGDLERFVAGRGGAEAPIRIYSDEAKITGLLKQWNTDIQGHQRAFDKISSYVPEFRDVYARTLSSLRQLQSDESVYLAAIERLKTTIAAELGQDRPEALVAVLNEYAEKYPRIAGLDSVRQDLQQYIELDSEARARRLGRVIALASAIRFSTPPFQEKFRQLMTAADRLPSMDVARQYDAASRAWREGNAKQSLAELQDMTAGPWGDVASRQLEHRKMVVEQFAGLQKMRGAKGYDERVLTFFAALDPEEDVYYIKATEKDVGVFRDKALKRAQDVFERAQAQWRRYRENGGIGGGQRLEAGISNAFRTQARLLSAARDDAQQGMRIYAQLKTDSPPQWRKLSEEIASESELQRRSLLELHRVLEPDLLKSKLALLGPAQGGQSDEKRQPAKTAE